MIRPPDQSLAQRLDEGLRTYSAHEERLPGIRDAIRREVFVSQLIESVRRVRYVSALMKRQISTNSVDPSSRYFDPVKAAALLSSHGRIEDAYWMVFLFTQFGKHREYGWGLARGIYGRLGDGGKWDWQSVSADPDGFGDWITENKDQLLQQGRFGNHRKYESLAAPRGNDTRATVRSYVDWVASGNGHHNAMTHFFALANGDIYEAFDLSYHSMEAIERFGRTARFDYLTMVGKLQLAPIEPGIPYLAGATGPLEGAKQLFGGGTSRALDLKVASLGRKLEIGMQPLEDALCNWQKSPSSFIAFRG